MPDMKNEQASLLGEAKSLARRYRALKGRVIPHGAKPGQRLGSIRLDQEWDTVVLVILDENFEPRVIYEADRNAVKAALIAPGSKARNERGALSVSKFKSIGTTVWSAEEA